MSLLSIAGTAGSAALQWLESIGNQNKTTCSGHSASSAANPNGTANLSQMGQFFAKLNSLAQSDPAQFKQLTAQIAGELSSAAQPFLQELAKNFQTASQTGSTAALQTQHHHHHSGAYSSSFSDPTNLQSALQNVFEQVMSA